MMRKPSMYHDEIMQSMFLTIAAGCSKDKKAWEEFSTENVPRIIREAWECSRTPALDEAYIKGVVSGLNARRIIDLDDVRKERRERHHECKCGNDCKCKEAE